MTLRGVGFLQERCWESCAAEKLTRHLKQRNKREKKKGQKERNPHAHSLYQALSHDALLFANKRGQPIKAGRLKLAVSPALVFQLEKPHTHTLTGHLATAAMTEANSRSI